MNLKRGRRPAVRRLVVAASVLAIHGAVIATIAAFEPPPAKRAPPIKVVLLAAPEPQRPKVEPPPVAEPPPTPAPAPLPAPAPPPPPPPPSSTPPPRTPAPVAPPPPAVPLPVKPVPRPPSPRPPEIRPIPVPEPSSDARPQPAPAPNPAEAPLSLQNNDPVPPAVPSPVADAPILAAAAQPDSPSPAQPHSAQSSSGQRTGPRIDASWAGNTLPALPLISRRLRESGTVRLSVHIDERGRVIEAKVTASSGFARLDSLALDTAKTWRFTPATEDGKPVAEWYHDWSWNFGD